MKRPSSFTALLCLFLAHGTGAQTADSSALRAADVIDVVVLGQPTLSGDFTLDKDGVISYPLIGRVEAAGLSPGDLAKKLQGLLGAGFIKRPEVSVRVKEYRSRPVLVLGEVLKPGIYSLKGDRSVLTTLSDAGGLTSNAGHEFLVARPPEGSESAAIEQFSSMPLVPGLSDAVRLPDADSLPPGAIAGSDVFRASFRELMKGNAEQNVILEGGDIVYVPKAAQIFVTGQAARPAAFKYVDGMTVQDALQLAGGISDRGSIKRLKIIRFEAGKRKEVKAELTDLLKPGDTLNVGERFF
ncbi:MAG: polysaccharide export protein [Vicinamibacteria bacterium]|nr:polysaccharide export protein [Vicinamibacteria bacterium]